MNILDRYICREVLLVAITVLFVLLLILTGNSLLKIMADVVSGELPQDLIFPLLGATVIHQSVILIPFSFFLGVVLAFGRLYQDSEMSAITASGMGSIQLYKTLLWILLPLAMLMLWMSLYVNAWAVGLEDELWKDAEQRVEITTLSPGKFNQGDDRKSTLFFERYQQEGEAEKRVLSNVFMQFERDASQVLQTAASAQKTVDPDTGNVYMLYQQGEIQSASETGYSTITFDEHAVLIREKVYPVNGKSSVESMHIDQLWQSKEVGHIAELQMRLSLPLAAILFLLIAVPMSHIAPRKGRYSRLGYAILLYFLYMYLLNLVATWVESGKLSVIPGIFILPVIAVSILLFYLLNQAQWFSGLKNTKPKVA